MHINQSINPVTSRVNFQGGNNKKRALGCTTALVLLATPTIIGNIIESRSNREISNALNAIQTTSDYNRANAEKSLLNNRLARTDFTSKNRDFNEINKIISDVCEYRLANSQNLAPVLIDDIKGIEGMRLRLGPEQFPGETEMSPCYLRGLIAMAKKKPAEAKKLATQLAYLFINKSIGEYLNDGEIKLLLEFILNPNRKPSDEEIKDAQDTYSKKVPIAGWGTAAVLLIGLLYTMGTTDTSMLDGDSLDYEY